jgi:hypothetical protein
VPEIRKSREAWQAEQAAHRERVQPWTKDRVERSLRGEKHPVYDFLFQYYAFRPAHLERYSPGLEVLLCEATAKELDWPDRYRVDAEGARLDVGAFPVRRLPMLRWTVRFLENCLERQPLFHCYGLHEWAMVYRSPEVRHDQYPLRISPEELANFVESQSLCCTHFDAYRFFTPAATPRNRFPLDRFSTIDFEQPGCIHANMDIYKWAFQLMPFVDSVLLADAFELAVQAREIDMRASPYDLALLGFTPIAIETTAGREEYVTHQQQLYAKAQPIRQQLLNVYQKMLERVSGLVGVTALAGQRFPSENVQTG